MEFMPYLVSIVLKIMRMYGYGDYTYGNSELRGWDVFETNKEKPKFGGRFQVPVPLGEVAVSYDNRHLTV